MNKEGFIDKVEFWLKSEGYRQVERGLKKGSGSGNHMSKTPGGRARAAYHLRGAD